jgi:antitoxin (DNA-binding transcriptional repressor) of toxin-antitoxin stability system
VSEVESTGEPAFITRRGKPVAVVLPISEDDLYDYVLSNAPEYVRDMREADKAIANLEYGRPLDEVLAELDGESA